MNKFSVEGVLGVVLGILGIGVGLVGQFSSAIGISLAWQPAFGWAGVVLLVAGVILGVVWLVRREPSDVRAAKRVERKVQIDTFEIERLRLDAALGVQNYFLSVATSYSDNLRAANTRAEIAELKQQIGSVDNRVSELVAARDNIKVSRFQRRSRAVS